MIDIEKLDQLLHSFIKEMPTLKTGKDLIESYATKIETINSLSLIKNEFDNSYKQFEDWLNSLLDQEKVEDEIIALNFGLYESEDRIQLYISGSKEWEYDDEDWASNNDYFSKDRYPDITLYKNLYRFWEDNVELGLFLSISTTIIYANTYLFHNLSKFPKDIVLATGFDDGDLYNFCKKSDEEISILFN